MPCDVSETSSLENVCNGIKGNIDFFVPPLPIQIKMNYQVNI